MDSAADILGKALALLLSLFLLAACPARAETQPNDPPPFTGGGSTHD